MIPQDTQAPCLLDPNPDIIGVGVRASLYALALSAHIFNYVFCSVELSNAIESSLSVTGLAIFLATVISTARGMIALFHVLCVFHLLGIAGISVTPRGSYFSGAVRKYAFSIFYVIAVGGSLSYLIYVFATAPTFGNQPECNDKTVYVLFFVNLPATNPALRWAFVAILGSLLLGLVLYLLFMSCLSIDYAMGRRHPSMNALVELGAGTEAKTKSDPAYKLVSQLAGTIYLITMLELMIQRNSLASGVSSWSFGQVLAVMMLIGPLIELVSLLIGKIDHQAMVQASSATPNLPGTVVPSEAVDSWERINALETAQALEMAMGANNIPRRVSEVG